MSAEEKRWQTEDDARALLRAEEVKSDKSRYAAARAALREAVSQAQAAAGGVGKK